MLACRHNTTGEVSNILFEDITLNNATLAISISADYGGSGCPCKWMTDYCGPEQGTNCRSYGPGGYCSPNQLSEAGTVGKWAAGCTGVGGVCGPEGDASNSECGLGLEWRHACRAPSHCFKSGHGRFNTFGPVQTPASKPDSHGPGSQAHAV